MRSAFLKLLQSRLDTYSFEGTQVFQDGMNRDLAPDVLAARLPLEDRIGLYAHIVSADQQNAWDPETYHAMERALAQTINLKHTPTLETAIKLSLGSPEIRIPSPPADDGVDRSTQHTVQRLDEQSAQEWLAYTLGFDLPAAAAITPEDFVASRLSVTEQGTALALLSVKQDEQEAEYMVAKTQTLLQQACTLTPALWRAFEKTCRTIGSVSDHPIYLDSPFRLMSATMADQLIEREILNLSPEEIQKLSDIQLYNYTSALCAFPGNDVHTPAFKRTRAYFYKHASVSKIFSAQRQKQIDEMIIENAEGLEAIDDDGKGVLNRLLAAKKDWHSLNTDQKKEALLPFLTFMSSGIQIEQPPTLIVCTEHNMPFQHKRKCEGFYRAWDYVEENGVEVKKFVNTVVVLDDEYNGDISKAANFSFRAALSTCAHETLHADYDQMVFCLDGHKNYEAFAAAFDPSKRPAQISRADPRWHALSTLSCHKGFSTRTQYVSVTEDSFLYRNQPDEKWVFAFENPFTAAFNGCLVSYQIATGERVLHQELEDLFHKVGVVLSARTALVGHGSDLVPLIQTNAVEDPFGALETTTVRTMDCATRTGITTDFSAFGDKATMLAALQKTLNDKKKNKGTPLDFAPLYQQAAGFLAQMPKELQTLKTATTCQEMELAYKLDSLGIRCQEMAEDLCDYAYVVTRQDQRQTTVKKLMAAL